MRKTIFAATVLAALTGTGAGAAGAAELSVTVVGAKPGGGPVMVGIFDSQAAFAAGRRTAGLEIPVATPPAATQAVFPDLPPGRYMAAVFQDADRDGKLTKNIFGVPVEAYGFAGEPKVTLGPPDFETAAVTLGETPLRLTAALTP